MNKHLIAIVVTLLVILGVYRGGYKHGWGVRDAQMQAEIAKANQGSRAKEQALNEKLNSQATQLQEANYAITEKSSALDRAIRSGRMRLSAPSCVQASTSAAVASGDRDQTPSQPARPADQPSDSERETLAAIAAIVAQGDRNTEQLNACIDAYNQVRSQLNGDR